MLTLSVKLLFVFEILFLVGNHFRFLRELVKLFFHVGDSCIDIFSYFLVVKFAVEVNYSLFDWDGGIVF